MCLILYNKQSQSIKAHDTETSIGGTIVPKYWCNLGMQHKVPGNQLSLVH